MVEAEILKDRPMRNGRQMPVEAKDFAARSALFLPKEAQYEWLVNLPDNVASVGLKNISGQPMNSLGEVVNNAMELVEQQSEQLTGILPKSYTDFSDEVLGELLRIFNNNALDEVGGDVIGRIYEYFLNKILKAKGFTVYHSKQGSDGGKDLLAFGGELGFGSPKICVQVKTQDTPIDRPTLDQLGDVMNNVQAEYGLLVSWNGFKDSVAREEGNQFFKIRLWDSTDVIRELFDNYEKLSPALKAEIPLKQIWILSEEE